MESGGERFSFPEWDVEECRNTIGEISYQQVSYCELCIAVKTLVGLRMGNKVAHPAPSYDEACGYFTADEISNLRYKFESWCHGHSKEITLNDFIMEAKNRNSVYERIMPRLFDILDIKRNKRISFEEYFCTVALLYKGSFEDKVKWLFLMYCPHKSSHLHREELAQFLLDASILNTKESQLDAYSIMTKDAMPLVESMVDLIIAQYSVNDEKLALIDFGSYAKVYSIITSFIMNA